jgi:hypothetical protein
MKLNYPSRCVCALVLGAAADAAGQHSPYSPDAERVPAQALCYALPPDQAHGNHDEHRPMMPSRVVLAAIGTSSASTLTGLGWAAGSLKLTIS